MPRLVLVLLAVLVIGLVARWLSSKPVVRFDLGPAEAVVAEHGVDHFALREADGLWRLYSTSARTVDDGLALPLGVLGFPALQADGSAFVLTDRGLQWVRASHLVVPGGEVVTLLDRSELPEGVRLEGVVGGKDAVLSVPVGDERRLIVCEGGSRRPPRRTNVAGPDGEARVPAGVSVICSHSAPALAFLGRDGWEAWTLDGNGSARRAVAEGCRDAGAVFTPDGHQLIVQGRVGGLWLLDLTDGRLNLMGEGDLGLSTRVPPSYGYRDEPLRLVAPHWALDEWLQICQTHVPSGKRWCFGLGFSHHYGITISTDGRYICYVQATFDEEGDDEFVEELYLFDFDQETPTAIPVDSRLGGASHQGPAFLGDGTSLVYLKDGMAKRLELRDTTSEER